MAAAFVYVISGEHGRQKIGSSDNPRQRIKDLQTGSPYPLKFEFIGETENMAGGQIEVEAHFMLNQHRAEGEWFVVPSDVAITAVMAAAHRLGYRCKPVDIDQVKGVKFQLDAPGWHKWATALAAIPTFGLMAWLLVSFDQGRIGAVATIICALILIAGLKLARYVLIRIGNLFISFDRMMHPDEA